MKTLVTNKKDNCWFPGNSCSEGFQNSWNYYEEESIFNNIKDLTSEAFLKINSTLTFLQTLAEPFEQLF